jgi:hypothetical protein
MAQCNSNTLNVAAVFNLLRSTRHANALFQASMLMLVVVALLQLDALAAGVPARVH